MFWMIFTLIAIIVYGLIFGSFINAVIWRIHQQDVSSSLGLKSKQENNSKNKVSLSIISGRSICPNCLHILSPRDLVPVFSWVILRGKCRYCKTKISWQYPVIEILTAVIFAGYYLFWPYTLIGYGLILFILSLLIVVGFIALAIYDLKWFILPSRIIYTTLIFIIIYRLVLILWQHQVLSSLFNIFWGIIIGGGLFYFIYLISKGKWIGYGDIRLGALIGVLIGGPLDSIIFLFLASLLGSLVSIPLLVFKKYHKDSIIPFGPFLILATFIIQLFGVVIIHFAKNYYLLP